MPIDRDVYPHCVVANVSFCGTVGEQNLGTAIAYKGDREAYQTPFGDNREGDDIFIIHDPC